MAGRGEDLWAGDPCWADQAPDADLFQADIAEVVHTHLNEDAMRLVVEWWTPKNGLSRIERE